MTGFLRPRATGAVPAGQHPHCWACSPTHPTGLRLAFQCNRDGSVCARFNCAPAWEGYPRRVHGGVIATLLDSAMTHCLFAHGQAALTGQLWVRFREPLLTERPATVRAWVVQGGPRLQRLRAELRQADRVAATADAKFVPLTRRRRGSPSRPQRSPATRPRGAATARGTR